MYRLVDVNQIIGGGACSCAPMVPMSMTIDRYYPRYCMYEINASLFDKLILPFFLERQLLNINFLTLTVQLNYDSTIAVEL